MQYQFPAFLSRPLSSHLLYMFLSSSLFLSLSLYLWAGLSLQIQAPRLHFCSKKGVPPLRRKRRHLVVQNPILLHDNARSHTAAVTDLLRRWQWEILEHPPYSPDMSSCDYSLFAQVKEPLRGTRYNTRDKFIRAIGRLVRNINKVGRADGVRHLSNFWQKVINKGRRLY